MKKTGTGHQQNRLLRKHIYEEDEERGGGERVSNINKAKSGSNGIDQLARQDR